MAKILIVEDEKAINDLVKFNLELVGHECSQVFDGESGLTEALKLKYDLIILDVMLPKYSGFEIMEYYSIIYYRIYMHDAGFAAVFQAQDGQIWGESTADDPRDLIAFDKYQLLAIDGATYSGIENEEKLIKAYETLVEWEQMWKMNAVIEYEHYPYLESALLYTNTLLSSGTTLYEFFIAGPNDAPAQQIYPTVELLNRMPQREFVYQAGDEMQPMFSLNYETGEALMSASSQMSFAMAGKFDLHDGVLKMYFGDDKNYVFHESGNGFVYSKENSKPSKSGGFDFADGLVFDCIHEGVSMTPNPDDPDNNTYYEDITHTGF